MKASLRLPVVFLQGTTVLLLIALVAWPVPVEAGAPLQFQFQAGTAILPGVHTNAVVVGGYSHFLNNNHAVKSDFKASPIQVIVPGVGGTALSGTKNKITVGADGLHFGIAESHWSDGVKQNAGSMEIFGKPIVGQPGQPGHSGIMSQVTAPSSLVQNKTGQAMPKIFLQFNGSLVAGTVHATDKLSWKTKPTDPKFLSIPGGFNGDVQKPASVQNYPANWITEAKTNGYETPRALYLLDEYGGIGNANWDVAENAITVDTLVIGAIVIGAAAPLEKPPLFSQTWLAPWRP